jgi:uncharacterized protein (DUF433 family)
VHRKAAIGGWGYSGLKVEATAGKLIPFGQDFAPVCCYSPTMPDWSSCPAVERDPARASGAWVFKGTRVPVAALFQNLEDGAQVQDFVDWFPGVSAAQVRAVLEHAAKSLEAA